MYSILTINGLVAAEIIAHFPSTNYWREAHGPFKVKQQEKHGQLALSMSVRSNIPGKKLRGSSVYQYVHRYIYIYIYVYVYIYTPCIYIYIHMHIGCCFSNRHRQLKEIHPAIHSRPISLWRSDQLGFLAGCAQRSKLGVSKFRSFRRN